MKKISIVLFTCAALALSAGCTRETAPELSEGSIVVNLHVDGMETKAETTILPGWLYLFDNVANPPFATVEIDGSKTTTLSFATHFGSEEDLVKRTTVFAVTGYSKITDASSLADIKSRAVTPLFLDGNAVKADPNFYMTAQGTFEKVDDNTTTCNLTLKRLAAKLTLEVAYTPSITTHGTMDFNGNTLTTTTTWTPITTGENVRVYLQNAVKNAVLGAASDTPVYPASFSTFTYDPVYMKGAAVSDPFYTYPLTWAEGGNKEPFIKLIQPWRFETVDDATGAVVNSNVVELYYKVMVPASMTSFDANTWYKPKVTLTVLGGEADRPATIVADEFQVLAWKDVNGTSGISDVAVTDAKFISVPTEISVERGTSSSFEVIASGPLTMEIKNISRTKFIRTPNPTKLSEVGIDMDGGKGGKRKDYIVYEGKDVFEINETDYDYSSWEDDRGFYPLGWVSYSDNGSGGTLSLNHQLSASLNSPDFAVTPYVYEIRLKLNSDNSVFKDVVITQTPAILLDNALSSGYVYINNYNNRNFYNDGGSTTRINVETDYNVYATALHTPSGAALNTHYKDLGYMPSADLKGYSTACKFRFLVDVVPYDEVHSVTDTRASITGDFATVFKNTYSGTSIVGGVRQYNWDYNHTPITPTASNQYQKIATTSTIHYVGATEEPLFVSPGFMIASSYGAISGPTYFGQALLRCATYQEDGYPAGRWRLPTESELSFVYELQTRGIMPAIFTADTWVSSGRYYDGTEFKSNTARHTVRCVYDTWYWGKDPVVSNETYTVKVTK